MYCHSYRLPADGCFRRNFWQQFRRAAKLGLGFRVVAGSRPPYDGAASFDASECAYMNKRKGVLSFLSCRRCCDGLMEFFICHGPELLAIFRLAEQTAQRDGPNEQSAMEMPRRLSDSPSSKRARSRRATRAGRLWALGHPRSKPARSEGRRMRSFHWHLGTPRFGRAKVAVSMCGFDDHASE